MKTVEKVCAAFLSVSIFAMGYASGVSHMARETRSVPLEEILGVGARSHPVYLDAANVYIKVGIIVFFVGLLLSVLAIEADERLREG